MKGLKLFFLLLSFVILLSPSECGDFNSQGQTTQEFSKYFKKTISFLDYSAIVSKDIVVNPSDLIRKRLAELISTQINLPRFYWESLPETTVSKFKQVVSEKAYSSLNELSSDVQVYIVPEIVRILDINKEMKALSLVSEADRERFISTKAKTFGIDARKIERVMNSGYIVIPFIDMARVVRDTIVEKKKGREVRIPGVRATINGGMAIYRVKFENNQYSIIFSYEVRAKSPSNAFVSVVDYKGNISPQDSAFMFAVPGLVSSFDMALREIFKLSAPVVEASFNSVKFDLGKREGVLIDDGFDIYEFVETITGEIKKRNVGFVRVSNVADNRYKKEYSSAQIIIGSIFGSGVIQKGMLAEERPRFPFDFVFGLSAFPVKVSSVDFYNFPLSAGVMDTVKIKKVSPFAYVGHFDINVNFGKAINKSQLWFILSANVGVLPLDVNFFGNDVKSGLYGNFSIGLMKKIYFRRLSVAFESRVGVANFKFSAKESSNRDTIEYALSLRKWLLQGGVGTGIEFVINPDLNIGVKGLYLISEKIDEWTFLKKVGDDEKRWKVRFGSPVSMSGFSFKVYFNISIKNFARVRKFED